MEVVSEVSRWRRIRREIGETETGFVPTMGALHEGHFELVRRSVNENPLTVVSIFVNPTQFNDPDDLEQYPVDLRSDCQALSDLNVDYVFTPDYSTVYPDGYRYRVTENNLSSRLCGASRPGHFDGVLTVVLRLFHIIRPTRAYFGEKDYQQLQLIRGMVESFFLDVEVVPVPIVREAGGLALSSRNRRLSREGRDLATEFARILREGSDPRAIRRELDEIGVEVDYVEEIGDRRFGAVFIEGVRLIDNVPL